MPPRKKQKPLTAAEEEIMAIVWDQGEVTVTQITGIISQQKPVNRNTVQTFLVRMKDKGWVESRRDGQAFVYRPVRQRAESARGKIANLVERYFAGSPIGMVNALLKNQSLSTEEADELRSLIDDAENKKRK
jgi:predicted transcriptional regulator